MRIIFPLVVAGIVAGCSNGPSLGGKKIVVPPGCTSETSANTGEVSCPKDGTDFAWLEIRSGNGDAELDKGEGIIRDAFSKRKLVTETPTCTMAGAPARCRRIRNGASTLALLGSVELSGDRYYVECAFGGNDSPPPVCNGFFTTGP